MTGSSSSPVIGLVPCPFCGKGETGDIERNSDKWGHWYFCDCGARSAYGHSPAEAASLWNTRASQPATPTGGEEKPWECMGRKQSLPEPGECNWPDCGCDPHATKVIESLLEQGWLAPTAMAQSSEGATIDDVPSCGQENDHRRARSSAASEGASFDLVEILEELSGVIEAVRGERDVLRVSGLLGDRQDVGVIGIDGFQELMRRTCEELQSPRHDAQSSEAQRIDAAKRITLAVLNTVGEGGNNLAIYEAVWASLVPSTNHCTTQDGVEPGEVASRPASPIPSPERKTT